MPRAHRTLVAVLMSLATVIGAAAMLAIWANRQALNTDAWTRTSSELLADADVQAAVSAFMVDELFSNVDVAGEIQGVLPPRLGVLAGPASAGLEELAGRTAPRLLASPQVQDAWRGANRTAHAALLRVIDGGGDVVSTDEGVVTLDLHALVDRLARRIGVEGQVADLRERLAGGTRERLRGVAERRLGVTLPPASGRIVLMRSDDLALVQDVAHVIRDLAVWLTVLMLVLFAAAIGLARGWRRFALRTTGWCFVGLGLVVLIARRVIGNRVIDTLVESETVRPAAHSAWRIGTTLLYDIGVAMLAYGIAIVVAAWLGGATRPATALRRGLAPALRFHLASVYGAVALAFLLVVAWGPTEALRRPAGIVILAALVVLGVELLRRQVEREHPDVQPGQAGERLREWFGSVRGSIRMPARRPKAAPDTRTMRLAELDMLASLHERGALTDAEFDTQKTLILTGRPDR